jgi:hypothetical protein
MQMKRVSKRAGQVGPYGSPKNTGVIVDVEAMHRTALNAPLSSQLLAYRLDF